MGPYGGPKGGGLFIMSEVPLYTLAASEGRWNNLKRFKGFDLKAKVKP